MKTIFPLLLILTGLSGCVTHGDNPNYKMNREDFRAFHRFGGGKF